MSEIKSILDYLEQIPDPRRRAGQRHQQPFVLLLVLMSTMSGQYGYRATGDFIKRNAKLLCEHFKPKKDRLPSFYTVRKVIQGLDFSQVSTAFTDWANQYVSIKEQACRWISADGKAIGGTVDGLRDSSQQFQSLVSLYCAKKGLSLGNALVTNSKQSEQTVFRELLSALDLKDVTFTLDALHCQKKQ